MNRYDMGLRSSGFLAVAIFLSFVFFMALPGAWADTHGKAKGGANWARQAEESFYLSPGMAEKLMTQNEWQKHAQTMKGMSSDRQTAYRSEWHKKMMDEARQKGLELPEVSPEHGKRGATGASSVLLVADMGGTSLGTDLGHGESGHGGMGGAASNGTMAPGGFGTDDTGNRDDSGGR